MIYFPSIISRKRPHLKSGLLLILFLFMLALPAHAIELKTAAQDSYPKYYKRNNIITTGVCIEIMQAVSTLDTSIQFTGQATFLPMVRIKNGLKNGELDVFFGFAKNPTREKNYQYAKTPLYPVNYIMALRQTDTANPADLDDIQDMGTSGEILVLANTGAARFLEQHQNLILDTGGRDINANLMKLNANRGRFLFYHDLGLASTIKRKGWQSKIRILPVSFRNYFHYVVFAKSTPEEVVLRVEKALKQLEQNGELARIHAKYTKF